MCHCTPAWQQSKTVSQNKINNNIGEYVKGRVTGREGRRRWGRAGRNKGADQRILETAVFKGRDTEFLTETERSRLKEK